eukprot:3298912-Alexandrium_andersonii.AAC.1
MDTAPAELRERVQDATKDRMWEQTAKDRPRDSNGLGRGADLTVAKALCKKLGPDERADVVRIIEGS